MGAFQVTSWVVNRFEAQALMRPEAVVACKIMAAPLSGLCPCEMIEAVQHESLSERG